MIPFAKHLKTTTKAATTSVVTLDDARHRHGPYLPFIPNTSGWRSTPTSTSKPRESNEVTRKRGRGGEGNSSPSR
jgi:hypothetical protein